MPDKFDLIVADLARCQKSSRASEMFGAGAHRYQVNDPLSEQALEEFENVHQCRLPEDYRSFLTRVGNGGAGPAYGLFPLGMMDDQRGIGPWGEFVSSLSLPFPHKEAWNDLSGQPSEELMEQDEDSYWRQVEAFEARYFSPQRSVGAFPICHVGCALRHLLVVTGDEAGHVWCDYSAEFGGLFPHTAPSRARVTFFDWYRGWLDEALTKL